MIPSDGEVREEKKNAKRTPSGTSPERDG